jgi:hypothetical protein
MDVYRKVIAGALSYRFSRPLPMASACARIHSSIRDRLARRRRAACSGNTRVEKTMKTLALLTLAVAAVLPAHAGTNIGVSIGINAPGQYGRIDINNYPQPVLVYPEPIVHVPSRYAVYQRPIYLYVPQTQQANWGRYCGGYGACGQPVYFVQENWVRQEYAREHDNRNGRKQFKERDHRDNGRGHDQRRGRGKHDD